MRIPEAFKRPPKTLGTFNENNKLPPFAKDAVDIQSAMKKIEAYQAQADRVQEFFNSQGWSHSEIKAVLFSCALSQVLEVMQDHPAAPYFTETFVGLATLAISFIDADERETMQKAGLA